MAEIVLSIPAQTISMAEAPIVPFTWTCEGEQETLTEVIVGWGCPPLPPLLLLPPPPQLAKPMQISSAKSEKQRNPRGWQDCITDNQVFFSEKHAGGALYHTTWTIGVYSRTIRTGDLGEIKTMRLYSYTQFICNSRLWDINSGACKSCLRTREAARESEQIHSRLQDVLEPSQANA